MVILPSTYLPSISYIERIIAASKRGERVIIDIGEHYIKRSPRNRAKIATAQGVMELTVPVKNANRPRQPMHSVEIDYSKRWQHQHYTAMLSAYKSSPFFDHYSPYIEPIYRREYKKLTELNGELLKVIFKLLQLNKSVSFDSSLTYIEPTTTDRDLRPKGSIENGFEPREYIQVFSDRLPFEADLSMLDLLFCEGPNALDYVGASRR
ncbi:MAG: WbqC family protein [Rikenellaceae bacterium]